MLNSKSTTEAHRKSSVLTNLQPLSQKPKSRKEPGRPTQHREACGILLEAQNKVGKKGGGKFPIFYVLLFDFVDMSTSLNCSRHIHFSKSFREIHEMD